MSIVRPIVLVCCKMVEQNEGNNRKSTYVFVSLRVCVAFQFDSWLL